ncbi:uncharacterized protein EAF02_004345 [Botrytis sinoallii]|uniref:uncharacterized protein n=1 Tax=Botrytis sinoallii TaxID=1463999 RepID=UPI001902143E|nr:uncharacterized protein EAF02_004345 [Botrytis sinoallii]KAF7885836.1 hypothetical protein EAF02_004345 [Botrytis sinoallii]
MSISNEEEILVTSRNKAPSIINVTSHNERVFAQLPDMIQEALVSTEFSAPNLKISRVHNARTIDSGFMTQPMFYITPSNESSISMPDLTLTDEKILSKFGTELTANFADIKAHGSAAFFQKENLSDGATYSLCACATGYIWVYVSPSSIADDLEAADEGWDEFSRLEIQIGTFALRKKAITTIEIPCHYRTGKVVAHMNGDLSLLCATVLAKYLRFRMMGCQYEYATESAIKETRKQLAHLRIVDPGIFRGLERMLREICTNAPMPPTSVVSLISRSMIRGRWEVWGNRKVLRRKYSLPGRVMQSFKKGDADPIDLLSESYTFLRLEKKKSSIGGVRES